MFERRRSFAATALLLAFAACDSPNAPRPPGTAAVLEIVSGDRQQFTVGEMLADPLVVLVRDASGRPVSDQLVNFRVLSGDGTLNAGARLTDEEGLARESWTPGTVAGDTQRVEVRALDRTTGEALLAAVFTAVGRPAGPSSVAPVGALDRSGAAGLPLADSVAVIVTDRYGNPVPATAVVWRVESGGGAVSPATSATDAHGVARALWTLGPRMDSTQVLSAAAGLTLKTQLRAAATTPPIVVLTRLSGHDQRGTVATELGEPLVVWVTLPDGRPLPGALLTWSTGASGGSVIAAPADEAGRVSARWTLGTLAGEQAVTASVNEALPVSFTATAGAAAPVAIATVGGNAQSGIVGTTLPNELAARVNDQYGNPAAGVPVHWVAATEDGSVHPDMSLTDGNGIARTTWTFGSTAGNRTVTASAGAVTAAFTATAEPRGTKLVFLDPPTMVEAGVVISPVLRVAIQNELGTTDPTATAEVTLVLDGPTAALASGRLTVITEAGIATFTDVRIDRPSTVKLSAFSYGFAATSTSLRVGLTAAMLGHTYTHSCVLSLNSEAFCWGANIKGQLGDGTTTSRTSPTPVVGGVRFATLSVASLNGMSTCGITPSKDAYCWGSTVIGGLTPTPVAAGLRFLQLSPGAGHTCGVTDTNDAYCWGSNSAGQLGTGSTTSVPDATPVIGGLKFAQVSTGVDFTCGITTHSKAYCWGVNTAGQLGDGTVVSRASPTPVKTSLSFVQVSAGQNFACGVTPDHAAYCWGLNDYGQLGDGSLAQRRTPFPVFGGLRVTHVSTSFYNTCAVTSDHDAYCWGDKATGVLDDVRIRPSLVEGGLKFTRVYTGHNSTCGVTTTGVVYCWAMNRLSPFVAY